MPETSKTFCIMPFIHMNLKTKGYVSACWRCRSQLGLYRKDKLRNIWNNNNYKKIRNELLNGTQHEGCKSCWDMEKSNIVSTRQQCNKDHADKIPKVLEEVKADGEMPDKIRTLEVRFSNLCNLRCRHCNSVFSSTWAVAESNNDDIKRLFEFGLLQPENKAENRKIDPKLESNTVDQITNDIGPNLEEILVSGGEPLMQPQFYDALEKLIPHGKNIKLEASTNLNQIVLHDRHISDLFVHFKKVDLFVSIDGDRDTHWYLRTGSDIDKIENNIKTLKDEIPKDILNLITTCTVSIYNISRYDKIIEYFVSLGCTFHSSLVQVPEEINIQKLPKKMKDIITKRVYNTIDKLEKEGHNVYRIKKWSKDVLNYMNNSKTQSNVLPYSTKEYINTMDKLNNTNFLEVFPEYEEYWL